LSFLRRYAVKNSANTLFMKFEKTFLDRFLIFFLNLILLLINFKIITRRFIALNESRWILFYILDQIEIDAVNADVALHQSIENNSNQRKEF
jgi:uncharacterized membrane protein YhaH (DUF805 family)